MKPTLFIGSSTARLPVARALAAVFSDIVDVTIWDSAPEFAIGKSILTGLVRVGETYDFALLVFGQDDATFMNGVAGQTVATVRDNVIFELGLFMGHMGRDRALWLSPKGSKAPRIASDLGGIIHLEFDEPEMSDVEALSRSLSTICEPVHRHVLELGFRTNRTSHVVEMRQALCLASSQYSQERFQRDIQYIHDFFSKSAVTSEHGHLTASRVNDYFGPGRRWDAVHLGLYVDQRTQELVLDTPNSAGVESLSREAFKDMIEGCGAQLVVIITCDSLTFAEPLARFTNVVAGYRPIEPTAALDWAKEFYRWLAAGSPLSVAFDKAQDRADPGLILLARNDVRFRRPAD